MQTNKFTILILLIILNCSILLAQPVISTAPIPSSFEIEARVRNGNTGFEGIVFTPSNPSPAGLQMNPTGAPVWNSYGNVYGDIHSFLYTYTKSTGTSVWSIDFNRDGDYTDPQETVTSTDPGLAGKGFKYLNVFGQGSSTGLAASINNLTLNGSNMGSLFSNSETPFSILYEDASGLFENISVSGNFSFSGGAAQEIPRIWIRPSTALSVLPLVLTESHENIDCFGNATGYIDLTVSGGEAPYTYAWNNSVTTQDISGLIAGTYGVTVTDALGTTASASVILTQPTALAFSETHLSPSCGSNGTDGSIDLTIIGGTPACTYSWTGPGGFVSANEDISGLSVGGYSFTATDLNGCSVLATINLEMSNLGPVHNISTSINYCSIQTAIDAAAAGNIIQVDAGTYAESLLIDKSLTLLGPNALVSPNTGSRVAEAVIDLSNASRMINLHADNITIKGFEIINSANAGAMMAGNFSPCTKVTGIQIEKNFFHDLSGCAIVSENGWSLVTSQWTITDNKINATTFGNYYGGGYGSGIKLWGGSDCIITDNVLTNIGFTGIDIAMMQTATISGNILTTLVDNGMQVVATASNVSITDNIITNSNTGNVLGQGGIKLFGDPGNLNVTGNTVSGSGSAFAVEPGYNTSGAIVNNNNFEGNTYGIYHAGIGILNATCNWYGTAVASQVAGKISGTVTYIPYSVSNGGACSGPLPSPETTIKTPILVSCGIYDIKITVKDFTNVGNASLKLNYDPLVFTYQSITLNPAFSSGVIYGNNSGQFSFSYVGAGITLPEDDVIFILHFSMVPAVSGGQTSFTWSPESDCEYSAPGGDPIYNGTFENLTWSIPLRPVVNTVTHLEYCKIQDALDDPLTANGHTITVAAGIYSEQVSIFKSIHLIGSAGAIIQAPSTLPIASDPLSNIILISGSGISAEITGFTIDGPGPSGCGSIGRGIFVRDGANANIHDNQVIDIRDNPFSGCQNGVAIQIGRNAWNTYGTATITNNQITGYQKGAIVIDNLGSSANISGNTLTGAGTTEIIAQNGVQISRGATATLSGNTISSHSFHFAGSVWDWGATGILLYQSGTVSLAGGNILSGNDQHYYADDVSDALALGTESFGSLTAPVTKGYFIVASSNQNLDARNCTFEGINPATATLTQLFAIEDRIWHSVDDQAMTGFVKVKNGNIYVTRTETGAHIQNGIDAASPGDMVNVQNGDYGTEIASTRNVFGTGSYQFGLYIDKDNLTVKGYKSGDVPVSSASEASVVFNTGSTANFGPSGIFVQSNGVTLEGLKIGDNFVDSAISSNKTIEVIGDAFTMNNCFVNTSANEGAFYMGRWDAAHPIVTYSITNNLFNNALVSINNGAGISGPRNSRLITGNQFTGIVTPYLIGFRGWNGANPIQGWIINPVGGAIISGNTFNNCSVVNYVLARGNSGGYDNSQFDWAEIWNSNTYGNHVVTLASQPDFIVRSYTDAAGYSETRRISPLIQENVTIGQANDVVLVSSGTFTEDVIISNPLKVLGAGFSNTTLSGPIGGANSTMQVAASGVLIDGFTITREGNNPTDWNLALNTAGVSIQSSPNSAEVRNCHFVGNRTAIDINNSNDNNIHNNNIDNNRTGIIFRNQTDNNLVQENFITNNWTIGVLFLDGSNGTNSPVQTAANCSFNNNNISDNWYGEIVDRQDGGALPLPGTKMKNFVCNWYGTYTPVVSTANSTEPAYIDQIPVIYGGTSVAPAIAQPDILGTASANIDYAPYLANSTDNDLASIGFQPLPGSCILPPVCSIASPVNNFVSSDNAPIVINAQASEPGGTIQLVELFLNNVKIDQLTIEPYSFTLTNPSLGNHVLTVKATDAYGVSTISLPVNITVKCSQADFNNDNEVNTIDFNMFAGTFGNQCISCPEDFNGDGEINTADFLIFIGKFGYSCN